MTYLAHTLNTKKALGFTMIELLVAATIIAILSAIGLVSFSSALKNARDGKRQSDLQQVRSALELYRSGTGAGLYPSYPSSPSNANWIGAVNTLNAASYIPVTTVNDPINDATHYYTYQSLNGAKSYSVCAFKMETAGIWGVAGLGYCISNP